MGTKSVKSHQELKAKNSENKLIKFFLQNKVTYIKLDEENEINKSEFLIDSKWKCPDFYWNINWEELFIEVKTITNTTNQSREEKIRKWITEVFEPRTEFIWPMESLLKDTSNKFKNISTKYKEIPRILFVDGIFWEQKHFICSIFWGIYETYTLTWESSGNWGWRKSERWLLDRTGSNISAIIYWNEPTNQLECLANYNSIVPYNENSFYYFFWKNWERDLSMFYP